MEIILILSFVLIICLYITALIFISKRRNSSLFAQGMNLQLFSVILPQITNKDKDKAISLVEFFKTAEQFYNSLTGLGRGRRALFVDAPHFVFEIAVHRAGEQIHFYVAAPRASAGMIEKQILSFWPKAQIQPTTDYNIFNPNGKSLGSSAKFSRPAVFPLKHFQEFGTDPLENIASVFTKLSKEDEGAALQVLIKPTKQSTRKSAQHIIAGLQSGKKLEELTGETKFLKDIGKELFSILSASPKKEEDKFEKKEISPHYQEIITNLSKKASQPFFNVNLRLLSSASDLSRAGTILTQLESAFEQFNSPILNQLKFVRPKGKKLKNLFYHFSFRIFSPAEAMLCSSSELAGFFHFPWAELFTPHIKWLKAKQAPAPDNIPETGILLGKNVFRGTEKEIRTLEDDRRRHFYIIGQTGTGKSALLQEMIRQDIENGKGVALIEPHGDLAEKVLSVIPPSRAADVIYFDPADTERPLGLNMLEYDPQYPGAKAFAKTFVANELLEIFDKLYNLKALGTGGPIFEQYMRNSLLLVMEDPESGSSLTEVPRVLADADFRRYKLSRCQNAIVKNFWEMEAEKAGGEAALANIVPYITSKMNVFLANDLMRPIIGQQKSSFNFREIMDDGKILIVNLSKGKLGDINSHLLGMLVVGKILLSAFSRVELPEDERRDFYLYIDEFQNFTTSTINTILAEARKYRLSLICAHQYIGQLTDDTRKAIFGNVGSMLSFRVGAEDANAEILTKQFEPTFDANDLMNFDNYNAGLKRLIRGETARPFNLITYPPQKGSIDIATSIKELSRLRYGRNREEVENEIYERLRTNYF